MMEHDETDAPCAACIAGEPSLHAHETVTTCAFCDQPIDYCQGHPYRYIVRVLGATGTVLTYRTAYDEDDANGYTDQFLREYHRVPGGTVEVIDQAGDTDAHPIPA